MNDKMMTGARGPLLTIRDAAGRVGKTTDNIRDYLQRGRIRRFDSHGNVLDRARNGELRVDLAELEAFLHLVRDGLEIHHEAGLSAELGFYNVPERERTKHVHRLHPYLGKFIPQLVEWFLVRLFTKGELILDPFMGSGTTLVQAAEMGIHSVGVDVSAFNARIVAAKIARYDPVAVRQEILEADRRTREFSDQLYAVQPHLALGNTQPKKVARTLLRACRSEYLHTWFAERALVEILFYRSLIETENCNHPDLLRVLLSRAARSSRLVPHNDLATPKKPLPVGQAYYCEKHDRMCTPIDNCWKKIHAYSEDTARRVAQFAALRSEAETHVICADSRTVDLASVLRGRKLAGVFTSPPYVGQIDYHDQHIYAYELFGIQRKDSLEIGPKTKGKSQQARRDYVEGISAVFSNLRPHLQPDAPVAIVANDKFELYPVIAERAGYRIVETFRRAVTKRTEKGGDPYQESVFIFKSAHDHSK